MNKLMNTFAAVAMTVAFATPAFAGINAQTFEERTDYTNIIKVLDKKVAKGITGGVYVGFAWVYIGDTYYSVPLRELRRSNDPSSLFAELIGADVAVDQIKALRDGLMSTASANSDAMARVFVEATDLAAAREVIAELQAEKEIVDAQVVLVDEFLAESIGGSAANIEEAVGTLVEEIGELESEISQYIRTMRGL